MIHIEILCIGKIRENYLKEAISEYCKRLSKYCVLTITELSDEKLPTKLNAASIEEVKQKECSSILAHIKKDSYVIALDLKGKSFSSEEFSSKLQLLSHTTSHITFLIGGTLGMTKEVLQHSKECICFSKMTFPHTLIRVFLLEQLFRAFKIAHGENYHH